MRPSDICVVLCSFTTETQPWISADEIRHRLARLGFNRFNTQQVAAWLKRISKLDAPPIEMKDDGWAWVYRATPYGETWVHNNLPDIWWAQQRSSERLHRKLREHDERFPCGADA
jgi:hypothetical protein